MYEMSTRWIPNFPGFLEQTERVGYIMVSEPSTLGQSSKEKFALPSRSLGSAVVGWHTFRHTVGTLLAELGEHQLTIRDYLRHSNLSVTKKYLQAASNTKRTAQAKLVEAILRVEMRVATIAEVLAPLLHPNKAAAKL
jgi:hypothetical protein